MKNRNKIISLLLISSVVFSSLSLDANIPMKELPNWEFPSSMNTFSSPGFQLGDQVSKDIINIGIDGEYAFSFIEHNENNRTANLVVQFMGQNSNNFPFFPCYFYLIFRQKTKKT